MSRKSQCLPQLAAERLGRSDSGGSDCWIRTSNDSCSRASDDRKSWNRRVEDWYPSVPERYRDGDKDTYYGPQSAPEKAECCGLPEDLTEDIGPACPKGSAKTDFAGAEHDSDSGGVSDGNRTESEDDKADNNAQLKDAAFDFLPEGFGIWWRIDLDEVRLGG